jgi:2-polyprenyl-3-methyl-5-hydroxy-6-metoxy-1,4-benzoquinol methylase
LSINNEESWQRYWSDSQKINFLQKIYNAIASKYRTKLIGPRLKHELRLAFPSGGSLLHAGSGGGEVDEFIPKNISVLAIDISQNAVNLYNQRHDKHSAIKHDIFELEKLEAKFDGLYNLGVMEHFSPSECRQILTSAHKILNSHGILVLFWPPCYGSSVIFLSIIHGFLRIVRRKKFQPLHPEEPNKICRPKKIINLLDESGFKIQRFSFSYRDFFTYIAVVASKK